MADFDFDDIRKKLAAGSPEDGAYDHSDEDAAPAAQAAPIAAPAPPAPVAADDSGDDSSEMNPVLKAHLDDLMQLKQAQAQTRDNQEGSGLTSALVQLTHGISRAPGSADLSGVQAMTKNDNAPVENVLAQQKIGDQVAESQRSDDIADTLRDVYKPIFKKNGLDPNSLDGLTADEIKSYAQNPLEYMDRMQQRREQSEQRASIANAQMADRAERQRETQRQKDAGAGDHMAAALKTDLDPNGGRAGNMGQNQKRVDAADRLDALIKQTGGNPDQRQLEELAIGTQNMLSNGNGSAEQVKALVPKTMWGDAKKMYEWFSNNPTGTDQQAFVSRLSDTVAREKQIAGDQVKTAQVQRLASHQALKTINPELYGQILQGYGIDPANIKNNRYESPAPQGGGFHPDADAALAWAKNNPNDPRSAKILQRLGAQGQGAAP